MYPSPAPAPHICDIHARYDLLPAVMRLGKRYSGKLGHFPEGAFEDHARRGWILLAVVDGDCAGYLTYRLTKRTNEASIVHLCVAADHRGQGLARALKVVGPANELYRRFQRLGVYRWEQVLETAKEEPTGPIMAISFRQSTLLPRPVKLADLKQTLAWGPRRNPFGPVALRQEQLEALLLSAGQEVVP